ncbi:MAG: dUTPase [Bacillota bacterium]|nr:dUTPase [Bacillota bacterium]
MDKLERIFELQKSFDDGLIKKRGLEAISMEEWLQKESLAVMAELSELLNEVNYKWWKNPKQVDMGAVKEELVDVLHFFVSMCIKAGLTAQELHDLYIQKNSENFKRQNGLSDKEGYAAE